MKLSGRSALIFLALIATLLAVYFAPSATDNAVVVTTRAARNPSSMQSADQSKQRASQQLEVLTIQPRVLSDLSNSNDRNVFLPAPQGVTHAVPVASAAPAPAQPPPLAFQIIGTYTKNGRVSVLIQIDEQSLVVGLGDRFAQDYKIESLQNGIVTVRYIPLNQLQTFPIGYL